MRLKNYKLQWLLERVIVVFIVLLIIFAFGCIEYVADAIAGLTN